MGNVIVPIRESSTHSYTINADDVVEAKITLHEKPANKQYVLKAMGEFLTAATQELRKARAHNKATLQHLH